MRSTLWTIVEQPDTGCAGVEPMLCALHRWKQPASCLVDGKTARSWRGIVSYAPRTGGAYDSHHRTAGIAGCTRRRGCRRAARGARAAERSHATHQRAQRVNGRGLSIPSSQCGIPARTWCRRAPKLVDEIKPIGDQAAAGSINRECYRRRIIPKLADPDSSCVSPSEPQKIVRWSMGAVFKRRR